LPFYPGGPPSPSIVDTDPRPDFYFLSVFAALALLPDWMEVIALFVLPALLILILIALTFSSPAGEKSALRRPVAVLIVIVAMLTIGTLAYMGERSPWAPHMTAWSADPVPVDYLKGRTPLEMRGAAVLQNKQCRNCHSLGGRGGERGPSLDAVATRLTRDEMVRQVIQGGGNMPAYGTRLNEAEVNALVSFMATLRPASEPSARDSAEPANP
jgi:ubiquinol-cytochrome c reductase cytochrome b subunit